MSAKVFSSVSFFEAQRKRSRVRQILIETLERRELLAVDALGCHAHELDSGWIQTPRLHSPLSFDPIGPATGGIFSAIGPADSIDVVNSTSLLGQPWFDMVREDYDRWSREQGLQFTAMYGGIDSSGLLAEGENNLTALDLYVAAPDPNYSFSIVNTLPGLGFTIYDLEMTSQSWRTPQEVTWDVWRHRLSIIVPTVSASTKSLLVIGGGGHGGTGGHGGSAISGSELSAAVALSVTTGTIVSAISNVPYQPLRFEGESFNRSEDALIAKSYRRYLDGGDEFWPALLPMVKSAVRAMDTAQTVATEQHGRTITDFVVTGASKRGWTTWLTAAVDPRVSAIAPQVINVLNMDVQMEHHRMVYEGVTQAIVGGYSAWVQDYVNEGIFEEFDNPRGNQLLRIVDPYEYRDRLTMPKFMINATGDQFFVPDSDQFFFNDLLGQNHLRYIPNYGHGLGPDAITGLSQFYRAMVSGTNLPQFSWTVQADGSIEVNSAETPVDVRLWQSTNLVNRDFRQGVSGTVWTDSVLASSSPGVYVASVPQPPSGHTAFMIELTYNVGGEPMKFTTEVSVVSADAASQFDFGPRLLSVAPNSGVIFSFNETNILSVGPTELVLRFDDSIDVSNLAGIQLWAAGKDDVFGDERDRMITPGWIGPGETDRIIIMRFSEPLVDDLYRLQLLADGPDAVRNAQGITIATRVLDSTANDRSIESVDFRLQLGARVLGVVPQPVERLANGALEPRREVIRVYFNDDDLHATPVTTGQLTPNPTVVDPAYYQLIFTNDTVQPGDDQVFFPESISYDPATDVAELTFSQPIDQLVAGGGTYRLRIGSRDTVSSTANPPVVQIVTEAPEAGGTVGSSSNLGTFSASTTILINGSVVTTSPDILPLDFPGSNLEPGHRDIQDETHLGGLPGPSRSDADPRITMAFYNFALNRSYGNNAAGQPVFTAITPEQIQRVREIFDIYSSVLGMDFIETEDLGMTIVVGDLFPLGGVSGGGTLGIANVDNINSGLAIMDGAQTWDNRFGIPPGTTSFFSTAIHEIGHMLGLGHTYDLPVGTVMGRSPELGGPSAYSYPGDHDIAHGLHLYRRDNRDVDMYSFVVPRGQGGALSLEVLAERLANASNLNSHLTLFKRVSGRLELVATNSGSFGQDAAIQIEVPVLSEDATYFVALTAKGNQDFNPEVNNTGSGGVSEGNYQLRVSFRSSVPQDPAPFTIVDVDGTPLDGNGDGIAGGNFNFWFRTVAPSEGGTRVSPRTIFVNKSYTGALSNGSPLQPMKNLNFASWPASLRPQPGDIIRVAGAPNPIEVSPGQFDFTNIPAYEFGRGGVGNQVLADGLTLQVPRGVTLMVDAGNIFKLQGSQITTGSQTAGTDNSNSALQVLGTPHSSVFFTSYRDETLGIDTNQLSTSPSAGDWGGIHFRNSVDAGQGRFGWERNGIFLDYIAGAQVQFGGGQVTVLNPSPVVAPITLSESRPTILNNLLKDNADAAISADPNSFRETLFTTPRYQGAELFAPDYSRVGPFIRGNRLDNNSINGLFVRTVTGPGAPLTTLDFAAKFDDTDIVHVISENLIINSFPGGNVLETRGPDLSLVQVQAATGGSLTDGAVVRYRLTNTDRWGQSGFPSAATAPFTVGAGGAVRLVSLPAATGDFVGRSLWRSINGGDFELVTELDRNTGTFTDVGVTRGGTLNIAAAQQRGRPNGRLEIAPGTIVKLSGSRIETSIGARLIAEGTPDRPIIFTSRSDDRYGAGGTFDTFNDDNTNASAGDWGGLVARHLSKISLDHVLVTYGGGITSVPGGFAGFNAVEVHQSTARIANSRFEMNQTGVGGNLAANRVGRGPNAQSVIYVMGSQPVIMDNVFLDNSVTGTAAISINANALNSVNVIDYGRQTGLNQRKPDAIGNQGPLVRGNSIGNTGINGMMVRGQILTTESIWDDTDIVHVLMSEIIVPDFHTYGGLTLRSRVDESLVIKLLSPDPDNGLFAGFTAMGRPLDITDRIGGSLRVLGSPGFPVVMTSLLDNSVGAGFDPSGRPLLSTSNNSTTGQPGDWRSIRFEPYANDRNVAMLTERESDELQDAGSNDSVEFAQNLGSLADRLNGGDENIRLGFSVDGAIASPSDLDVYSFTGTAGTMVWFDIDRTSGSLDAVLELLDADGNILAQSVSSLFESLGRTSRFITEDDSKILPTQVMGLDSDVFAPRNSFNSSVARDFHSLNPHDPGMRVILPGTPGETSTYFVRVRSSNVPSGSDPATTPQLQDPQLLRNGLTTGNYRMQMRLRQTTEIPGSTVQFADIRFATNGIEAFGMPASSPLLGQVRATGANPTTPGSADLGNILNSDRGSVSVAGQIQGAGYDEFTFTISRDSIQSIPGFQHASVVFDIDYADGFGGPDTSLWVYDSSGRLVYFGTGSNISDDQPAALRGNNTTDLSRGSAGRRDAYIGPVELLPGNYTVRVSNSRLMDSSMNQLAVADAANTQVRVEPLNSVKRLAIHRFDALSPLDTNTAENVTQVLFDANPQAQFVPWNLSDVRTYIIRASATGGSELVFANAMSGALIAPVAQFREISDADLSGDGRLFGYQLPEGSIFFPVTDENSGQWVVINPTTGAVEVVGETGIETFTTELDDAGNPVIRQKGEDGDGMIIHAVGFLGGELFGVASRGNGVTEFTTAGVDEEGNLALGEPSDFTRNIVYRFDPETGEAINFQGGPDREDEERVNDGGAGTNKREYGRFLSEGRINGLTSINGRLFAVSNLGELFAVQPDAFPAGGAAPISEVFDLDTRLPISFSGLTRGPSSLHGDLDLLFGTTADGTIYAFDTSGELQPVFPGFSYKTRSDLLDLGEIQGISFAPLSRNLWNLSGIDLDPASVSNPNFQSLHFGNNGSIDQLGGAHGAIVTKPFDLSNYSADDLPVLYFSYRLDGEPGESDAFRVYAQAVNEAGQPGDWRLLAASSQPLAASTGSRELYKLDEWRQARVPLNALAGSKNVRLRFEFSTAGTFGTGDPLTGGVELTAIEGWRLADGTGFSLRPFDLPGFTQNQRFEFDHGFKLALPGGASLIDGVSAITVENNVLTFSTTLNDADHILYSVTDSPNEVAIRVRLAISNKLGIPLNRIFFSSVRTNVFAITGLETGTSSVSGMPPGVVMGLPGVAPGNVPIPIHPAMTAMQVRDVMRTAFASVYSNQDMANAFPDRVLESWHFHSNDIRLYKFTVAANTSGIGVTNGRIGEQDIYTTAGALNNEFRGVFLDDIIIGFAERGEAVRGGDQFSGFVPNNPFLFPESGVTAGRYQLTIRTAAEYGFSTPQGDLNLDGLAGRDFDTNDRLSRSVGIQVNANAAGRIADGRTFTLTDTKNSLTFEFDVIAGALDPAAGVAQGNVAIPISLTSTPEQIADAIRDAINSPTVQNILNISASLRGQSPGSPVLGNSRIVEIHGRAASDLTGRWTFAPNTFLNALRWGDETRFGEDLGDVERERPQGQLLLMGNTITDAAQWGIVASAGDRIQPFGKGGGRVGVGDRPYPGAPINFPSPNAARLAPGIVVMNNILANNTSGGLLLEGDPGIDATVQIARVMNNTFFAGADGILIEGGASPTVLNNIFAQTGTGVRSINDNLSVLGANIYQGNQTDTSGVNPGTFNIFLLPNEPLFVSTANRRFYLAAGSRAIDASLESLQERDELSQVKSPLGLPLSPMLAPDRDINGILRVDDPAVASPDGLGGNVFKDRGAVERADFVGPVAVILRPRDNDALGIDIDRNQTFIAIEDSQLNSFTVLLQDLDGVGPDPDTVLPSAITLTENGRILRQDLDYVLGYNANTRVIRFTPLAGIWRQDSVYEITLNNTSGQRLSIPGGANLSDGDSITVVRGATTLVLEFDNDGQVAGNAISVPFNDNSTPYELAARIVYLINRVGASNLNARLEGSGQLMIQGATQVNLNTASGGLVAASVGAIRDLAGNRLQPNRATGLTQFTIVMPEALQDFGDARGASIPTSLDAINMPGSESASNGGRHVILPVDLPLLALGSWSGPDRDGQPSVAADGDDYSTLVNLGTLGSMGGVSQGAAGPARLIFPAAAGLDGQRIVIEDTGFVNLPAIIFEFDTSGSAVAEPNKVIISLDPGASDAEVAEAFSLAVKNEILAGRLTRLTWDRVDNNQVSLGGTSQHRFDLGESSGVQRLSAGNVQMVIPADLSGLAAGQSMSITDSVGREIEFVLNPIAPLGLQQVGVNVNLDTATPQSIATAFAQAIGQQIAERKIWLGGAVANNGTVTIIGDDEDGISFGGPFNAASAPVPVFVRSTGFGMLDAWIDWNGNGSFNDGGDRLILRDSINSAGGVATSVPVRPGLNVFYVTTPANSVVGLTTARFRLSALGGLLPGGVGIGGEVEDHRIEIVDGRPPLAVSNEYTVLEDNTLVVSDPLQGILANDSDPDLAAEDIELGVNLRVHDENPGTPEIVPLVNVSFGSLVLFADGTFTYTPRQDFNNQHFGLPDFFVYRATDGRLVSNPVTVTINVAAVNDPPQFQGGPNQTVLEDAGPIVVPNWATNILAGPPTAIDELQSQTVSFDVVVDRPDLFLPAGQPEISSNGNLTFQTAPDANGTAVVTVVAVDNGLSNPPDNNRSAESFLTITILPVNDPPVFTPGGIVNVLEDSGFYSQIWATSIAPAEGLLANPPRALDEANQQLNFVTVSVSNPQLFLLEGQPRLLPDGTLQFTTAPHRNGTTVVVVRLDDDGSSSPPPNNNRSENRTITISIAPVNDPPEFTLPPSPAVTVLEDQGLVTVPGFATGIRPGPIEAVDEVNQTVSFIVEAVDPSVFTVQPSITSNGTLSFRVAPNVNTANVSLDGRSLDVRVRLEDDGPSSPPPNSNTSEWKIFTIDVTPVNDPPQSPDFVVQIDEGSPVTLLASEILVNASGGPTSDEASQRVWITQVEATSARGGSITAVFNAEGTEVISITYTPPANAVGTDSFVFIMRDDGNPSRQGTARVIIQIAGINDPPQFDRGPDQTVLEDAGPIVVPNWATNILPGPPSAIDEIAGQTVSFELIVDRPDLFLATGLPAISPNGTLTYQTALDANGVAVVRVVAVDNGPSNPPNVNRSAEVLLTITILPVNDPPVFTSGGNVTVDEDSGMYTQPWATNIAPAAGLLANPPRALDEASQTVSFTVQSDRPELFTIQPAVSSEGVLSFQSAQNAFGITVLTIRAVDSGPSNAPNQNTSDPVFITLTIVNVNDPPVAVDDFYTTDENSILSIAAPGVLANDFDIDFPNDQIFAVAGTLQSSFGAVVVLNENGSFTYDPREVLLIQQLTTGQSVIDTFVYQIRDLAGAVSNQATVFVTVNGVDDPPVAVDDFYAIGIGQTVLLDVLSNDFDIDTAINPASIQLVTLPIFGSVTVRSDGIIQYVPSAGFQGTERFSYTVRDVGGNVSNEAFVTILIGNPPLANSDLAVTNRGTPVLIPVLQNDVAGSNPIDPTSVRILTPPSFGDAQVQANGSILYTPAPGVAGEITFTYVVSDTLGLTSTPATVIVRILSSQWQNSSMPLDVSGDGRISALDALLVINYLNSDQPRDLPGSGVTAPPFIDVNGDERVTALDALLIINYLNERSAGGGVEGEGEMDHHQASHAAGVDWAVMVTPEQMINAVGRRVREGIEATLSSERELAIQALRITNPLKFSSFDQSLIGADSDRMMTVRGSSMGGQDQDPDSADLQSLAEWVETMKNRQSVSSHHSSMIDWLHGRG